MADTTRSYVDYALAIICALPLELAAVKVMLDEVHAEPQLESSHQCSYILGKIGDHKLVVTCLPSGVYGTTSAAAATAYLRSTFPNIRCGLMVGIGGGVPSETADIRLGDVVVSKPTGTYGGVVQYDMGKTTSGGHWECTGTLNQPPPSLLMAIAQLEADDKIRRSDMILQSIVCVLSQNPDMQAEFSRPTEEDRFFLSKDPSGMPGETDQPALRALRDSSEPHIYYGIIASGNQVMKDGQTRDQIARRLNALCYEMEAAGIMNHLPCLVIRGICDYCDSHKNKQWQGYAALAAAAYAKRLLSVLPAAQFSPSQTARQRSFMVPFDQNPHFRGRTGELERLETLVLSQNQIRKAAISGLGGVGKTQVVINLAYRICDQAPQQSIFWIQATSVDAVEKSFADIGRTVGLPNTTPDNIKADVKAYLSSERAGSWLLIVDNADDADMWMSPPTALKDFLPRSETGFTIFTTRNQQLATRLVGPEVIKVSELDGQLATELFRASLMNKDLMTDDTSAMMLLHQLGGLPLVLIQAASYINQNCIGLKDYSLLLNEQEHVKVELLSQDFEDDYRYEETQNPVATTWLISFEQIRRSNLLAEEYLSHIACINHRDIPLSLLPQKGSPVERQKALGLLKAYSFITQMVDSASLNMHRLVHLAMRTWLRNENLLEGRTVQTCDFFNEIFPSDDHQNRALWREYLPHAQFLLQTQECVKGGLEREDLCQMVALCLSADGRYNDAEPLFQEVHEKRAARLDKTDLKMLKSMVNLVNIYWSQKRWNEAEELNIQVLNNRKITRGLEHPETLDNMSLEHPETLTRMSNLAGIYRSQGRWKETEELLIQVLDTRKTTLGLEHPETLTSMANLASIYSSQGQLKKAEELESWGYKFWILTRQCLGWKILLLCSACGIWLIL
ncbi:uncharacterized protein BDW47DRAFT_115022 [Aspergillus candidus]|uniref:Purine and uridine phosphorylase n=1 Tax=Aspergillus candidus TaxID=41067 RepID=A0A2I2FM74_ASPCN|nr:hypothetical protein BDW47DRAFT_115022 [Aspergillus candidus]PLB41722.1 hypothetical protein BDW47DRAFT_115022 [Aspergillus candidus]